MSKINLVHGDGIIVLKDYIHSLQYEKRVPQLLRLP
jgi:hypothetical protein